MRNKQISLESMPERGDICTKDDILECEGDIKMVSEEHIFNINKEEIRNILNRSLNNV